MKVRMNSQRVSWLRRKGEKQKFPISTEDMEWLSDNIFGWWSTVKNEGDEKKILVRNLLVIGDGLKGFY